MIGRVAIKLAGAALLVSCGADAGADAERVAVGPADGATGAATRQNNLAARRSVACASGAACRADEIRILQCRTKDAKTIAVCSAGGETATYRFGGTTPEIEIEGGRWARVGYSGGGELKFAFTRDPYRYIVFSRTVRTNFEADEPNNPAFSDGVLVLKGHTFVGMKPCDPDSEMAEDDERAEAAMAKLPQQDELFTYEASRADPEGYS